MRSSDDLPYHNSLRSFLSGLVTKALPNLTVPVAASATAAQIERTDAYYWRLVGTALSFLVFGSSALILSMLVLPLLHLLPRWRCQHLSRRLLQWSMRKYVGFMVALGLFTYEFNGWQRLGQPGQLIVANHPTLIDVMFLLAFTPQAGCVVKYTMLRNWLTRGIATGACYISNASAADMLVGAAAALRTGQCLIMFPEGTRSRPGEPLDLQRGAASVAVRAASRVTPVYVRCDPVTLTKSEPWYRIAPRRPHFTLTVGEDLPLDASRAKASIPLASRHFNEVLRQYFQTQVDADREHRCGGSDGASTTGTISVHWREDHGRGLAPGAEGR